MSHNLTALQSHMDGGLYEMVAIEAESEGALPVAVLRRIGGDQIEYEQRIEVQLLDDEDRAFAQAALDARDSCPGSRPAAGDSE